jgi:hypothetical protein
MQVAVERVSKMNNDESFAKEVVLYKLHKLRYVRRPGRNGLASVLSQTGNMRKQII